MGTNEIETELRTAVQSALKTISDTFAPGLTFSPELVESLVAGALSMAKSLADPNFASLVEELSVKCDRWSQWEEVVAVALTHLQSAGRLVSDDDIRLTTVQRSDVITVANYALQYGDSATGEAAHRLVSRFPVTGPSAPSTQSAGGDCFDVCEGHPAPAEPAEEETKAEVDGDFIEIVFDGPPEAVSGRFVEVENPQGASISVGEWIDRGDGFWALRIPYPSSPVVPAPTETGPWMHADEIPNDVTVVTDRDKRTWKYSSRTDKWTHRSHGQARWVYGYPDPCFAPFVAAEEG